MNARRESTRSGRFPLFLYDGDCAFCTTSARFIDNNIPGPAVVAAWQHVDLDALPVTEHDCESAVQWIPSPTAPATAGPRAIADLLRSSTAPWWRAAGSLLAFTPVRLAAEPVYRLVAANRDKLPGGTPACVLPQAERDARDAAPDRASARHD